MLHVSGNTPTSSQPHPSGNVTQEARPPRQDSYEAGPSYQGYPTLFQGAPSMTHAAGPSCPQPSAPPYEAAVDLEAWTMQVTFGIDDKNSAEAQACLLLRDLALPGKAVGLVMSYADGGTRSRELASTFGPHAAKASILANHVCALVGGTAAAPAGAAAPNGDEEFARSLQTQQDIWADLTA